MQHDDVPQDPQLHNKECERNAAGKRDIEARLVGDMFVDESSHGVAQKRRGPR